MIPQNPMFVLRNKGYATHYDSDTQQFVQGESGLFMNASTGANGVGPATLFKDLKSIEAFIKFYQGQHGIASVGQRGEDKYEFDFEILEVEVKLVNGKPLSFSETEAIIKSKKIKKKKK